MFQMKVENAMRMNETHRDHLNASLSMAHDALLGIVTIDSLKKGGDPDQSTIADNPPVAGAAGASDPTIAAAVRGMRDRALPMASPDREQTSGKTDTTKFDPDAPSPSFVSTMAQRALRRRKKD